MLPNIISVSTPKWADAAHTVIELTLETDLHGVISFAASPNDTESHGRDLFARAVAGEFGTVAEVPLETVSNIKLSQLDAAYNSAVQQPVSYMGTTFQADAESQSILTSTLVALNATGVVPPGFGWWDANNVKVPMTLAELNGLAGAMLAQGWTAFQNKQAKKDAARAAASLAEVAAVTW